jgi:capsular polysaccharide transport system permease protein
MIWRNATSHCGKAVEPNIPLLFHRNVKVIDLLYSRALIEIAGATISTILIGLVLMGSELIAPPKDPLTMVFGWMLLQWYGLSMGLMVGTLSERYDWFEKLWHPAMYFYLGISGAFYMVQWLPTYLQRYAIWVPTVTVTEMLRHGYWGEVVHTYEQPGYLCVFCACATFCGHLLARETEYRIGYE